MGRGIVLNILAVLLLAGVGMGVCTLMRWTVHYRDLTLAGVITLVASAVALLPLRVARGAPQSTVTLAGLAATSIQLLLTLFIGGALVIAHAGVEQAFLYWLLAMYPLSLLCLAASVIGEIKKAPGETAVASQRPVSSVSPGQ